MNGTEKGHGQMYRLVIRGELDERFAVLFEGMSLERSGGTTVLTGKVTDQAHLQGLLQQAQELGLELVSIAPVEPTGTEPERPTGD
jgi:hypothetical protein